MVGASGCERHAGHFRKGFVGLYGLKLTPILHLVLKAFPNMAKLLGGKQVMHPATVSVTHGRQPPLGSLVWRKASKRAERTHRLLGYIHANVTEKG